MPWIVNASQNRNLQLFKPPTLRTQVSMNKEVFEEVMLIDLKNKYGATDIGRPRNLSIFWYTSYVPCVVGNTSKTLSRARRASKIPAVRHVSTS